MFAAAAPSAPTLSTTTSPASPTSPPRSGRLRGLSYLRSYTSNHLHSHSSDSSAGSRTRPSLSRARSQPSPGPVETPTNNSRSSTRNRRGQTSSSAQPAAEGADTQSAGPNATSGWLPTVGGRSGLSRVATRQQSGSDESPSAQLANTNPLSTTSPSGSTAAAAMTRNRSETAAATLSVRNQASQSGTALDGQDDQADGNPRTQLPSIRFIPHQDARATRPSLTFPTVSRILPNPSSVIRVGRYSERDSAPEIPPNVPSAAPIGFKSKVVSRRHCEFWCQDSQWYIKDVKSSSGTFLNHIRLSAPGVESRPHAINDGDVVQLGIDFRGGEEMIFRCVKIRIECNRGWQKGPNKFNKSTHQRLRNLAKRGPKKDSDTASMHSSECAICLMSVAPCQSLFVAPCSHVWHYKCIRPMLNGPTWPNFLCPNCRAVTDLEADVDEPYEDWEDSLEDVVAAEAGDESHDTFHQPSETRAANAANLAQSGNQTDNSDLAAMIGSIYLLDGSDGDAPSAAATSRPVPISSRSASVSAAGQNEDLNVTVRPTTPGTLEQFASATGFVGPEGPMTPMNDAGPFVLDGGAGRPESARRVQVESLDQAAVGHA